jgi:hypothetical protein
LAGPELRKRPPGRLYGVWPECHDEKQPAARREWLHDNRRAKDDAPMASFRESSCRLIGTTLAEGSTLTRKEIFGVDAFVRPLHALAD